MCADEEVAGSEGREGREMAEMADEVYIRLREFLDGLPGGFPPEAGGLDIEYLKRMFTPEEAEVELHMKPVPEPASAIAWRCGKPEQETEEILESMAGKGLILPVPTGDRKLYMALQYMTGFGEQLLAYGLDSEAARLCLDYHERSGFMAAFATQRQMRVVPVSEAVDATPAVATYDRLREMVMKQDIIAVTPCPCRVSNEKAGRKCEHSIETELSFGFVAEWRIDNGFGRRIGKDEALRIIDEAEETALVLAPTNTREAIGMCMCGACCCHWLQGLKMHQRPADHVQSSYQARINTAACSACGTCLERCQMEAIVEKGDAMEVDTARCIGCGLCVSKCPEGAVSLVAKHGAGEPSPTYLGMFARVAGERGLPLGKAEWLMNRASLATFMRLWKAMHKLRLAKPVISYMAKKGMV